MDTHHFKGNFPDSVAIEGAVLTEEQASNTELLARESNDNALFESSLEETIEWVPILARSPLKAAREHQYKNEILNTDRSFTHVRIKMYPDGGISRLRLWGEVDELQQR